MFAGMLKVGIDANRLLQIGHGPALRHQKSRPVAKKDFSRAEVTARSGRVFVIN